MIGKSLNRRNLLALTALALLAGCKIIPKGPVEPVPVPSPAPSDGLPSDAQRHRVALLVPMSGATGGVGQSIANATTQALLDTNAQNLRITTYDTVGGAAGAAARALADGNKLILGPLDSADIAAILPAARAAHVPLITYSGDASVAAADVFTMGTDPGNSIDRTVRQAAAQGATSFAVLTADGDYGRRAEAALRRTVAATGGRVIAAESYVRGNGSAFAAADRLRTRGGFDAVLITDTARVAAQIAPRLKRVGAISPRILGTELWSGESLLGSTPALRGAWFSAVADTRFRQFADSYQGRFGVRPYRVATLGYDSVLLTIRVARDWRPGTAFPVARLRDSGGFLGLDGPFRFVSNGAIERALEVREARSGGITIISAAPDRFDD
jgi:branched-chain amino acid transport system substrate-binding protein